MAFTFLKGCEGDRAPGVRRWLWLAFVRTAIVPLLLVEVGFLVIFLISNTVVHKVNVAAMETTSEAFLESVSRLEADRVESLLLAISRSTQLLASSTGQALDRPFNPPAAERARYAWTPDGTFYTRYDIGTTASFYSGVEPIGTAEIDKVWRLSALDPLMMDLEHINPLVASIYINTSDSYNRIYPYFDVLEQYGRKMRIPDFNFFYEADARHNPGRGPKWTEAYIDPAGHGWMISSIAPVWRKGTLEAVVGQDVTLARIIKELLALKLPWGAYAMLVDGKGKIIAMPPAAEQDLAVKELTRHDYDQAIHADTKKPRKFDLLTNPQTKALGLALTRHPQGRIALALGGGSIASFHEIGGPGWRLVIVARKSRIFAEADQMRDRLATIGWAMAGALVLFYVAFFWFLYRRARSMGEDLAGPIEHFAKMFGRIGQGEYRQEPAKTWIAELDEMGREIVATGRRLEVARDDLLAHQQITETALVDLRKRSQEELRFIRIVSHEVRTPLAIIDSGSQILERKAADTLPSELIRRARKFRAAVARITDLVTKLELSSNIREVPHDRSDFADVTEALCAVARQTISPERLELTLSPTPVLVADGASFGLTMRALLDNAVRYGAPGTKIEVSMLEAGDRIEIRVRNHGKSLDAGEAAMVGERFFRGSNAANTDGAGLSLFLARKSLESIGGSLNFVWGENETCVTVVLPPLLCPAQSGYEHVQVVDVQ